MITINGQEFSEEQVRAVFDLCAELMKINDDQNASLIAFDAKLKNEEAKVRKLTATIMMFTNLNNNI